MPHSFVKNDYKGYLEDRRPNSQGDPYQIASQILKTISTVPTELSARTRDRKKRRTPAKRRRRSATASSRETAAAKADSTCGRGDALF